jgi:hypothetical protein
MLIIVQFDNILHHLSTIQSTIQFAIINYAEQAYDLYMCSQQIDISKSPTRT